LQINGKICNNAINVLLMLRKGLWCSD